jgi:amidophosphoribosyltransferase
MLLSDELRHECGVAALYWLDEPMGKGGRASKSIRKGNVTPLMPSILLDLQNRGQLAAGLSSYNPQRTQLLDTFKDVGTVSEVFRMSRPDQCSKILGEYEGRAAIGHTRYATCGADDARYAQPFERHHGRTWKWFCFAFNGNLANFADLRGKLLGKRNYHFSLNTDTEIIMHELAYRLRGDKPPELKKVFSALGRQFDGAYDLCFLDAMGRMVVARDPLGFRPMSWAVQGRLFAAANESTALANLGFTDIRNLDPGQMAVIEDGKLRFETFAAPKQHAHCFFEWVYFSNVASTIDGSGVYLSRARSGQRLAELEDQEVNGDCIVVPVPDTAKAAADAFAYQLGIPSVEGLIRNRYIGRTFIQPNASRGRSAKSKYTPLPEILSGRRVFLVEDSIVRSTTLKTLVSQIRKRGKAREIHVRVACPPIVAPCFYGIDMSTLGELFAPKHVPGRYDGNPTDKTMAKMAEDLQIDSLRYLSTSDLGHCLHIDSASLCTGCVTGKYPTSWGNKLMRAARRNVREGVSGRTYE